MELLPLILAIIALALATLVINTFIGCWVCELVDDENRSLFNAWKEWPLLDKLVFVNSWPIIVLARFLRWM